jgi:hypothetical protein
MIRTVVLLLILSFVILLPLAIFMFIAINKKKTNVPTPDPSRPDPDMSAKGTCSFEGEDVYNQKVFSYNGDLVKPKTQVDCSQCNQYVVKQDTGCLPMGYDKAEGNNVCVAGNPTSLGTWGIPPIMKCPFDKVGKVK